MGCVMIKQKESEKLPYPEMSSWGHVHKCTIENWVRHDCENLGFNLLVDYTNKKLTSPWCTQGRHFECILPAPLDEDELDVKYVYDEMLIRDATTWRSTRIKLDCSYEELIPHKLKITEDLETVNIIGVRGEYAVTQVIRLDYTFDFILTHLPTSRVVTIFQHKNAKTPFLWECYISPDYSVLLLKPSLEYFRKHNISVSEENVLKYIQCNQINDHCECVTRNINIKHAKNLIIAFDPRYRRNIVSIANCSDHEKFLLKTYNFTSENESNTQSCIQSQFIQNMTYSPGGDLIACLHVQYLYNGPNAHSFYKFPSVTIYSSQDLSVVHTMESYAAHMFHSVSPATVFPVFSKNGTFIAVGKAVTGIIDTHHAGGLTHVEVYKIPPLLYLKDICRRFITNFLSSNQIQHIALPEDLKEYLAFKPTSG